MYSVASLLFFFFFFLHCLVGCLSMIAWTPSVLGVLYACVLYFCICTCSAQLSMFHMDRRPRNTLIFFFFFLIVVVVVAVFVVVVVIIVIIYVQKHIRVRGIRSLLKIHFTCCWNDKQSTKKSLLYDTRASYNKGENRWNEFNYVTFVVKKPIKVLSL